MKRILILEDNQERVKQFNRNLMPNMIFVTDRAAEAISKLETQSWDVLFLDHDLGNDIYVSTKEANTGSAVAQWLHDNPDRKPETIIIHSYNTIGQQNMKRLVPESVIINSAWVHITSKNLTDENIKGLKELAKSQHKRMLIG